MLINQGLKQLRPLNLVFLKVAFPLDKVYIALCIEYNQKNNDIKIYGKSKKLNYTIKIFYLISRMKFFLLCFAIYLRHIPSYAVTYRHIPS